MLTNSVSGICTKWLKSQTCHGCVPGQLNLQSDVMSYNPITMVFGVYLIILVLVRTPFSLALPAIICTLAILPVQELLV